LSKWKREYITEIQMFTSTTIAAGTTYHMAQSCASLLATDVFCTASLRGGVTTPKGKVADNKTQRVK
jgi:hypothetical protein